MDEQTNKKIEELKKNPPNRVFPLLVLVIAVIAVFLYRVASTGPNWETADVASSPSSPVPVSPSAPRGGAPAKARSQAPSVPASTAALHAKPETAKAAAVPAGEPERAEKPQEAQSEPAPKSETAVVSENGSEALDAYLTAHLGQEVPFLYKGEKRVVTLAAFSEETVTIKRKKSFTMKRSELSNEQLKLWK